VCVCVTVYSCVHMHVCVYTCEWAYERMCTSPGFSAWFMIQHLADLLPVSVFV